MTGSLAAGEEIVLPSDHGGVQHPFSSVISEVLVTLFGVSIQHRLLIERISERTTDGALGRYPSIVLF